MPTHTVAKVQKYPSSNREVEFKESLPLQQNEIYFWKIISDQIIYFSLLFLFLEYNLSGSSALLYHCSLYQHLSYFWSSSPSSSLDKPLNAITVVWWLSSKCISNLIRKGSKLLTDSSGTFFEMFCRQTQNFYIRFGSKDSKELP